MKSFLRCCSLIGLLSLVLTLFFVSEGLTQTGQPLPPPSQPSSEVISDQPADSGVLYDADSSSPQGQTLDQDSFQETISSTDEKGAKNKEKDKDKDKDKKKGTTGETLSIASAMSEGGQGGLLPGGFSAQFQTDPQTGAAVASIPIEVPPGRGGLTPQVVLSYNSMNGNSWVGTGWELTMGYIQRSTRKGVPPLIYQNNQVTYTDNSEFIFVATGASTEIESYPAPDGHLYHAKIEGSFLRYEKFETGNYWEVTDKSGTKYIYGQNAAARTGPNIFSFNGTFKWLLEEIRDTKGNAIVIDYCPFLGSESSLCSIYYNYQESTGKYYTIAFKKNILG